MSKVQLVYWQVLIALIASFVVYNNFSLVINLYIMIAYIVIIIGWALSPFIILQWYMWSKDKDNG